MRADVRPPWVPLTLALLPLFPRGAGIQGHFHSESVNPVSHPTSRDPKFSSVPWVPDGVPLPCPGYFLLLALDHPGTPSSPPRSLTSWQKISNILNGLLSEAPHPHLCTLLPLSALSTSCRMKAPGRLIISPTSSCPQTTQQQAQRWEGGGPGAQSWAVWRRR